MDFLVCIYLARVNDYYRAFMTHNPEIDAEFFRQHTGQFANTVSCGTAERHMDLLTPLLPVGIAYYVLKTIFTSSEIAGQFIDSAEVNGKSANGNSRRGFFSWLFSRPCGYEAILSQKIQEIKALLDKISDSLGDDSLRLCKEAYPVRINLESLRVMEIRPPDGGGAVMKALEGRILFYSELEKSLLENQRETPDDILDTLQFLALSGKVRILPSLGFASPGEVACYRCGNTAKLKVGRGFSFSPADLFHQTACSVCGFNVICCEQCNSLGESRLCKGLFAFGQSLLHESTLTTARITVKRRGGPSLTPAQSKASNQLREFVRDKAKCECLLWAACGAGKTEVIFEAVQETLSSGGQVLYASPRRDVVIEIAPRLEQAFEGLTVNAVYGGSSGKFGPAGITAATAHQVIRFYQKFDLVIMDEVDAYPYKDNVMLHVAVRRAVKPDGKIIYLTATPSTELLCDAGKGKIRLVTIPARYHGYPVPEPKFMKMSPFVKDRRGQRVLEPRVKDILKDWIINRKGQVFVFLPTVKMIKNCETVIERAVREISGRLDPGFISFSYAGDHLRDYKRDCFKQGSTRVFVTTSIMERGITVANAYVVVLNSDFEYIFDEGTLIQMSGRAGRSMEHPHGDVIFVGERVTGAMKGAREKIRRLNNEARKLGYLNPGW